MKKILIIAFLVFLTTNAQESNVKQTNATVGDELVIGAPSSQEFEHIHFPKTNFIIKKGGIANYKALTGKTVIITNVDTSNGKNMVTVKRKDGLKFFNRIATVKINLDKAISSGEIKS